MSITTNQGAGLMVMKNPSNSLSRAASLSNNIQY